MTLNEAMAAYGPAWFQIWMPLLMLGGFVAPLALLIWRESRKAGAIAFTASLLAAIAITVMYDQMGYIKLLGLPHIILWVPLLVYLWGQSRRADLPVWPRRIMLFAMAIMAISLAFDITDAVRYVLGERTPLGLSDPA